MENLAESMPEQAALPRFERCATLPRCDMRRALATQDVSDAFARMSVTVGIGRTRHTRVFPSV